MSQENIRRFIDDLKSDARLQDEVKGKAAGIPALLEVAKSHGYDITKEDVRDYIRSQGQELTEEQLETVSGGAILAIEMLIL